VAILFGFFCAKYDPHFNTYKHIIGIRSDVVHDRTILIVIVNDGDAVVPQSEKGLSKRN
jgi:hypothetical protein